MAGPILVNTSTLVDRSGTILTGGTSQPLLDYNASRKGYRIMNLSDTDLWINDTGGDASAGTSSYKIAGGQYYEPTIGIPTQSAVSIFGSVTDQPFSAAEW